MFVFRGEGVDWLGEALWAYNKGKDSAVAEALRISKGQVVGSFTLNHSVGWLLHMV